MGRPALYMQRMWRSLPEDILESNVLPLLPMASLCRFRAVSKKWNTLITRPDFAVSHALSSPPEEFVLITVRADRPFDTLGGWDVLDVANNKVFTLGDDFLRKYVKEERMNGEQRKILAADGGLFFLSYSFDYKNPECVLLVCNPVLRVAKLLPPVPGWVETYESVVMSTDRVSMEYEILVFHHEENHYQTNSLDIYESKTGRWRRVTNDPTVLNSQDAWYSVSMFVKLNGFYRLYRHGGDENPSVIAFDKMTGLGSDLGFELPIVLDEDDVDSIELVVSQDRLFCVSMRGAERKESRSIEIFEVVPARHECTPCTEMPRELLKWLNGDDLYEDWDVGAVLDFYENPVVSIGCASSILICSCVGRSVGYNLADKSWHQYSDNNLLQAHEHFTWYFQYLYCSNYCLSLCVP